MRVPHNDFLRYRSQHQDQVNISGIVHREEETQRSLERECVCVCRSYPVCEFDVSAPSSPLHDVMKSTPNFPIFDM